LLTGATSFIGRHLATYLAQEGIKVTATYRTRSDELEALQHLCPGLDPVQLDLADAEAFRRLPSDVDAVLHVAGTSVTPGVSIAAMMQCNVVGAENLLRYALNSGAKRLVYTSSLSVHGRIADAVVDETTPIIDPDVYGASKYLAERLFATAADRIPSVAIRLPGVLGRGAHRAWVPMLRERLKADRPISIFNPEAPFNNAVHVDDLVRFICSLLTRNWYGFFAFPVAASGMVTIREVVELLAAALGVSPTLRIAPAAQSSFTISSQRAIETFDYRAMNIDAVLERYATEQD
jgi:UDP-glucose 4-epimerase